MPAEGASWPATFRRAVGQRDMNAAIAAHERFLQGRGTGRLVMRFAEALELDCGRRLLNEADFTGARLAIYPASMSSALLMRLWLTVKTSAAASDNGVPQPMPTRMNPTCAKVL